MKIESLNIDKNELEMYHERAHAGHSTDYKDCDVGEDCPLWKTKSAWGK